jgi:zinc transport system permease protein
MLDFLNYSFMIRAFIAGSIIGIISPLIGTFLVLRKYALIADTLAHVALLGIAIGLLTHLYPPLIAILTCIIAAIAIDKLRSNYKMNGDSALSLFLSGSLAIALTLISLSNGLNANLFSYLFGSIIAVEELDLLLISGCGLAVLFLILGLYKELLYLSFDEEAAKVNGLPVKRINLLLMILTAITVSLSIRIVGALLVGALIVIPVLSAIQISKSFKQTIYIATGLSIVAVWTGLILSFYFDIVAGGAIVLTALLEFIVILIIGNLRKVR